MTRQYSKSVQSQDLEESFQMLILKGLYGPMYGKRVKDGGYVRNAQNQLEMSWRVFGKIYEQL